jgi:hypothetical protein
MIEIDYEKFMKDQMGKALSALPPKERADMNRLVQNLGGIMGKAMNSEGDLTKEVHKEHADFTERINSAMSAHDKMQDKYGDNSNK